ncbi:MAG: ankyrin repeat domain-containing protein [Candidatus Tritonobacter lacicola]|nr:ankyrin repeat domain-containing protein [Candidatus Tritonobacter lacicola]
MKGALATALFIASAAVAGFTEPACATDLMRAAQDGDTAKVKLLIEQGANINDRDAHGMTPLMHAAGKGRAEVVKLLLESGADASAEAGETALYDAGVTAQLLARARGHTEVANILKRTGIAGRRLWKYMVIAIWTLLGTFILSMRVSGTHEQDR